MADHRSDIDGVPPHGSDPEPIEQAGPLSNQASGHEAAPRSAQTPARRAHTYSRLTTAAAILALVIAGYAVLRLDALRDRVDEINVAARTLETDRNVLRTELRTLSDRERRSARELDRRLDALDDTPRLLEELTASLEELRGRAEGPERAWSRAEAAFLLELAQRRLVLERDIDTAIIALESADSRLAALRDPSFAPVRQQIARELQALHAVSRPDTTGVLSRLAGLEEQAAGLPVKGIVPLKSGDRTDAPSGGAWSRAWAMARASLATLIVVRDVDEDASRVVTAEQELLRREHLQLLLFAARNAVARNDLEGYRSSLAKARLWVNEFFDLSSPAARSVLGEIQMLESIDIDPPLPDISGSSRALRRLMPSRDERA